MTRTCCVVLAALCAASVFAAAPSARAQETIASSTPPPGISGAISAGPVFAGRHTIVTPPPTGTGAPTITGSDGVDAGAGLWLDLWVALDWFRIGGLAGVIIVPSSTDAFDRYASPLALSMAAVANLGDVDLELRARGGMWGGSTQEVKMTAGGFLGGGAFLTVHLGGGASLGGGVEVWGFLGAGATWALAPCLTLTFGPPPVPATPRSEEPIP